MRKEMLLEKDIVLEVAKLLKVYLEDNDKIAVVLTRADDYYLPLRDRILWAEQFAVDLFVSLHADNSETSTNSSGLSIYTLSEVASDIQAQKLANNANQSDIVAGVTASIEDEMVNRILASLAQRVKVNDSIVLAQNVVMQSADVIKLLVNPVRSAGFAVLKVPNTPSVLIELGFLSNEGDRSNFQSISYKQLLARNISIGILAYLYDRKYLNTMPEGINLEALRNANTR